MITQTAVLSQSKKNSEFLTHKSAISISALGPSPMFGIVGEQLLGNTVSLELALGVPSIGIGLKVYPFKAKTHRMNLHLAAGGAIGAVPLSGPFNIRYGTIGFSYFGGGRFNLGLDAGLGRMESNRIWGDTAKSEEDSRAIETGLYGNFRIGFRF